MSDPKGFMNYGRELPARRPIEERKLDWVEVYTEFPREKLQIQAARCMDCGIPFCHQGCPLGNIIPDWNDLVYRGRWKEALAELHATNNFPEFTGKLCPAPCESACVLGINQEPVTIRRIEESLALRGWEEGWISPETPESRTGKRVAIVGSGPAGLAAAQQLNRAGHLVTVFERDDAIGGLLRYGIPDFKMEKRFLDRRLEQMQAEGVVFQHSVNIGVDLPAIKLVDDFDAVLLACGSTLPRDLPVPGRELNGIHFAMEYLPQQNRRVAGTWFEAKPQITAKGKRVVILGGGDTGADCLGTVLRQGAAEVYQFEIMPKPPESRDASMPWPNYPMILRTSAAHEEGGIRDWSISTQSFSGDNGCVTKLHAMRVELSEPDENGRRSISEIPESAFEIETELVLLALGFVHPERDGLVSELGLELDHRGNVKADKDYATSIDGVFAAGDMRRGQSLIVWAIAEGREAARSVDMYLMGTSQLPLTHSVRVA
jgi:glutamate synthase (NADPH/NADH) small chain